MNKKVYITMLVLSTSFLLAMYVLKIFYPQEFMLNIQNERIIAIGTYIDSHLWLRYICAGITSFIVYWLYCCACCKRLSLKWYECLYIIIAIVIMRVINIFDVNIATHLSIAAFFVLPAIMKGDIKIAALIYLTHGLSQCLMLKIRNLPMYLTSMNYLTILFVGIETYLWLLLFYVIFNYKKKENKNEKDIY